MLGSPTFGRRKKSPGWTRTKKDIPLRAVRLRCAYDTSAAESHGQPGLQGTASDAVRRHGEAAKSTVPAAPMSGCWAAFRSDSSRTQ